MSVQPSSTARSQRLLAALVALVVALGACSGDDDGGEAASTTTTTTRSSTTSSTAPTEDEDDAVVRQAYEDANRAFIEAAAVPDPNHPGIAATHTGPMLDQTRDVLAALQRDQRIIRYPANSQYRIVIEDVEIDGDVALLKFCGIDDGERVDTRTGDVISSGVLTARGDAAMRLEGETWKLAEQSFSSREEGVAACD